MNARESIIELLARWEEQADGGIDPSPADLCPENPALWPELAERIARRRAFRAALDLLDPVPVSDTSACATDPTCGADAAEGVGEVVARLAPPQAPGELGRLGPYRVRSVLGSGGMGVIFEAEEPALARSVALKVMRPGTADPGAARERFLREAKLAASLEHDHVVPIFQVGEVDGTPFLAMPLLKGEPLAARLAREGKLTPAETARVGREAAEGLAAAHATGLIHRDIKPANLWLEGDRRRVKILDFGLARVSGDAHITRHGAVLGTPAYMAPEQGRGEPVDARADLFSLGCTLYQCCTGRLPFTAPDAISTLLAVARDTPPPPHEVNPAVPAELSSLIVRLLAKDAAARPQTARAVADELAAMEFRKAALPPTEVLAAVEMVPAPRRPRHRMAVAGLLLALVAAVAAAVIVIRVTGEKGEGTLTIETVDPDVEVVISKNGREVAVLNRKTKETIALPVGPYEAAVRGGKGGAKLAATRYEVKSGEQVWVRVAWEPGPAAVPPKVVPPVDLSPIPLDPANVPAGERSEEQPKELVAILGTHQLRHWGEINQMEYSPDGRTLAVYGWQDRKLRLWDTTTGRLRAAIDLPPEKGPHCAALHPDGKTLLVGGKDEIVLWDITKPIPTRRQTVADFRAIRIAVSGDGKTVATVSLLPTDAGGYPHAIRVWRYAGEKLEPVLTHQLKEPYPTSGDKPILSPDGRLLVLAGNGGEGSRVWSLAGEKPEELPSIQNYSTIKYAGFTPDGRRLVLVDLSQITFWGVTGNVIRRLNRSEGELGPVRAASLSADGTTLAVVAHLEAGPELTVWDVTGEKPREVARRPLARHGAPGVTCAWHPNGKSLAVGSRSSVISFWNWNGRVLEPAEPAAGGVGTAHRLHYDAPTRTLFVAHLDDGVMNRWRWDGKAFVPLTPVTMPDNGHVYQMAVCCGGTKLVALVEGTLIAMDLAAEPPPVLDRLSAANDASTRDFGFVVPSPDGNRVAYSTGIRGRSVGLVDVAGSKLRVLPGLEHPEKVRARGAAFLPDGKSLLTACDSHGFFEWDLTGDKPRVAYRSNEQVLPPLAVSADGTFFLAESGVGRPRFWDRTPGGWTLSGLQMPILRTSEAGYRGHRFALSPVGPFWAYRDVSGARVDVWAMPTPQMLQEAREKGEPLPALWNWTAPGEVNDVLFLPDGRHLVLANGNGTVYVVKLPQP